RTENGTRHHVLTGRLVPGITTGFVPSPSTPSWVEDILIPVEHPEGDECEGYYRGR
ncbi:hypothetical protein BGZ97_003461, partial [Linnemannia gamsii]